MIKKIKNYELMQQILLVMATNPSEEKIVQEVKEKHNIKK